MKRERPLSFREYLGVLLPEKQNGPPVSSDTPLSFREYLGAIFFKKEQKGTGRKQIKPLDPTHS
jgi:hypothetical protein